MSMLASEWLKLRTVRVPALLVLAAVAVTLVLSLRTVLEAGRHGAPSIGSAAAALSVLGATRWGPSFALVLGVLVVTDELRHGTITGTLLVTPDRRRVFVGKLAVAALAGLALGALTLAAALSVGLPGRAVTPAILDVDIVGRSCGLLLLHPAYAVLGAGIGAVLNRFQSLAVLLPLAWLGFLEQLLVGVVHRSWLPWTLTGAAAALGRAGDVVDVLPMWGGAAAVVAVCLALAALGGQRLARTDLT